MTPGMALKLASGYVKGTFIPATKQKIEKSADDVRKIVNKRETVYGINTGFGPLCTSLISDNDLKNLQANLLKSHCVGVGKYVPDEISRLMMILKIHSLSQGFSGVSWQMVQRIHWFVEEHITPCVPLKGSIGASGDLAPLAHLFIPLIGLGKVKYKGQEYPAGEILNRTGIKPLELRPKEGLALINGTQFIAAYAVKVVEELQNCLDSADIIAATNLEAMLGSAKPFDERLHTVRPFKGCVYVADRMRTLLANSEILDSHKNCGRVQDPYSLRCIAQVHGASRNAWLHLKNLLITELNAVTDNPVIFDENTAISGGNFHGQPLALPLDYAAIAASELGNIADRRIYLSLEGDVIGLPKLLMENAGLYSGFMIPQYTSAALVSENKSLCYPASADSIPTSLGQEDHVSMGPFSARKALMIVRNLEQILGIELFCSTQGFDFRRPLKSSTILNEVHEYIRSKISFADTDRIFSEDIHVAAEMIKNKEIVQVVNDICRKERIELKNEEHELFGIY